MCSRGSKQMAAILDQKNYLEELNRHLKYDVLHLQLFFHESTVIICCCFCSLMLNVVLNS